MPNSSRKNRGFLGRLYSPINRGLQAVGEIGHQATNTVGNVFGRTLRGVRNVGRTATSRVNQGVSELVSGRKHKGGRRNMTRKNRRSRSRRNRH